MQLLTFRLNDITFGIPVQDVETIHVKKNLVAVPGGSPEFQGIMDLQGDIIAVYSLAKKFGLEEHAMENLVIIHTKGMKLGIEVEQVNSILEVEQKDIVSMPEIMQDGQTCLHDVVSDKKDLIVLLDVEKIVSVKEHEELQEVVRQNK